MRKIVLLAPVAASVLLAACEPIPAPTDAVATTMQPGPIVNQAPLIQPPIQSYASSTPMVTISGDVAFDTNQATLRPEFRSELDSIADQLLSSGGTSFEVVGHTDVRGSASYNQDLSERRARAVANYLVTRGVSREYLSVRGEGETNPLDRGTSLEAHKRNRRVEIIGTGGGYTSEYTTYPGYNYNYNYTVQPGPQYAVPGVVGPSQIGPAPTVVQTAPQVVTQAPAVTQTYVGQPAYSYTQAAPMYPTTTGVQPQQNYYYTAPYTQQVSGGYVAPSYGTSQQVVNPAPQYGYTSPYAQYAPQQVVAAPQQTSKYKTNGNFVVKGAAARNE